jgi:hypothetical protein
MPSEPFVIVLAGLPGSGKTSLARWCSNGYTYGPFVGTRFAGLCSNRAPLQGKNGQPHFAPYWTQSAPI